MNGYIYVMLNMSMEGLVKIGRTNRDPKAREKELSQATGVPTPFKLVYQEFFIDCIRAEQYIHEKLDEHRVSNKREFFTIHVYDAIKAIQQLKDLNQATSKSNEFHIQSGMDDSLHENNLGISMIEKGYDHLYGLNGLLQDSNQALVLFKKAERLGEPEAFYALGDMYTRGDGCKKNIVTAIEYYKKGSHEGIIECYPEMAILFSSEKSVFNLNNAEKCWDRYFQIIIDNGILPNQYKYFVKYIMFSIEMRGNLNYIKHIELIKSFQNEILVQFDIELDSVADNEYEDPHKVYYTIKNAKNTFVQQLY